MKKDNSLRKAARWVARMFGYKAENKFARGLWYVFATGASVVSLMVAVVLVIWLVNGTKEYCSSRRYQRMVNSPTYLHEYRNRYVSIIAIGPDRFHCDGPHGSVILDSKGREYGGKPCWIGGISFEY